MSARELFTVTGGRVSALHRPDPADPTRTRCRRPAALMTELPADPWAAAGFRAASAGPCQRCARRV